MRLNIPIIPRQTIVRNIIRYGTPIQDNNLFAEIQGYIKEKFGIVNIYDIVNPYVVRSAIIDAGDKTEGVKHYLVLDETGYTWEEEYSDEVAREIHAKISSDIDGVHFTADEQNDIKSSAETILFKDFGYDEYFEHIDLEIFHRVVSSSNKATLKMFYKVFQTVFSDLFLNVNTNDIDDDRLAVYLSHLIITYMTEWDLEDTIIYKYDITQDMYKELTKSNISTYLITLFHDFDKEEYTDEMKYTIATIIVSAYLFIKSGFMSKGV